MKRFLRVFLILNMLLAGGAYLTDTVFSEYFSSEEDLQVKKEADEEKKKTDKKDKENSKDKEKEETESRKESQSESSSVSEEEKSREIESKEKAEKQEEKEKDQEKEEKSEVSKDEDRTGLFDTLSDIFGTIFDTLSGPFSGEDNEGDADFPVKESVHSYEICAGDVSWSTAKAMAEAKGGYLCVITDEAELKQVTDLIGENEPSLKYIWLGGHDDGSHHYKWINGEAFDYAPWYEGEPSFVDENMTEDCLCLWNIGGKWTFNDQRDDLAQAGAYVEGKIGYVIEYED